MPSLFGGSSGPGGPSKEQKGLFASQQKAIDFGLSQAETTLPQATAALQDPLKFFNALLTGDRNTLQSVLGPEINTLTSQYETGRRSTNEFAPRGGGSTAANAEARFKESSDITNLVGGARKEGAAGQTAIAQLLSQLGLGELGTGTGAAANLSSELLAQQQNQQQQQQQVGQGIGQLIALLVSAGSGA
jgi:hypothetical protein